MTYSAFPPSITTATGLLFNHQETTDPNVVTTDMDAGLKKIRKRYTKQIRVITGRLLLNAEQKTDLKDFYADNIASRWTWTDPDDGTTEIICRFRGPLNWERVSSDLWYCNITYEIVPT